MARGSLKNVARLLNNINTDIPVAEQFIHDLTKSIEMQDSKNSRKPSQTYKPSGMNCIRSSYYQIKGIEPDDDKSDYGLIGIGESGTDRHIRIQKAIDLMRENGFDCEYINIEDYIKMRELKDLVVREHSVMETKCYNEKLNMSFLTDGIIKYKGKYYLFEFKTETANKWYGRLGVDKKHYNQAIAYSLNFGIDNVIFVYENRDTCQKKAYMLEITDTMKQDLVGYILNCDMYVEQNKVPPKPDIDSRICQYCGYKSQCRKDH